jgi:hypothetical protein
MAWRKWFVRSLVFLVVMSCGGALWVYQHWTNPEAVRLQVLSRLGAYLPGANVMLDSAQLRLLDGIALKELNMARRDDPRQATFAHFATGTIYHEKDRLIDGKLLIRKLDFPHAVLHIVRRPDGTWNLDRNILANPDLRVQVPMIVLKQATIFIEDQFSPARPPPLEIKSVNLTIKNDPLSTLVFEGKGLNDVLGPVQMSGSLGRKYGELLVKLELTNIPVNGRFIERLAAHYPDAAVHARELTGQGKLRIDLSYQPNLSQPWSHEIHAELSNGKLRHARLPQPLEAIEARARCVDGQVTIERAVARSGLTEWQLSHLTLGAGVEGDLDGHLEVQHLAASSEVFAALPEKLRVLQCEFSPCGCFTVSTDFARRGGQWREHAIIQPEGVRASYDKFPYPLEQVRGKIENLYDPARSVNHIHVNLAGYSNKQPVYVEGDIDLKPAALDLKIWGKNVLLDEKLRDALPAEFQKIVSDFAAAGLADVEVLIHRTRGAERCENRYVVRFHDVTLKHTVFPYPLENVSGTLDIHPQGWDFHDFRGMHKGGEFRGRAASAPDNDRQHMTIEIAGSNVLLDAEMEAALKQPGLKATWARLAPSGRINFKAGVEQTIGQDPDIAVFVALLGCEIYPQFFPYRLSDLQGLVHYRHNAVELEQMSARHGAAVLNLKKGLVTIKPEGDVSLDLVDVGGNPILPEPELFLALPKPIGDACARLQLHEPLSLLAHLTINVPADGSAPYIYWDGGVRLKDATLNAGIPLTRVTGQIYCRGEHHGTFGRLNGNIELDEATVLRQTLYKIHGQLAITDRQPNRLSVPDLASHLYSGDVGGEIYIDFGANPQFVVNLVGTQLRLEEFGRMNHLGPEARLQGKAGARLYLHGQGFEAGGLEGAGSIDVPSGKMYNLPFLLDLLKVLNLSLPDKTAFEEAHIQFGVRGEKVNVSQLSLIGNAVSLNGQGTVNLNGTDLNLDFYSVMGHIMQWMPPGLDKIPPLVSKQLLKIKVRGSFTQPQISKEPVPAVVEPLKVLFKLMGGRQQ